MIAPTSRTVSGSIKGPGEIPRGLVNIGLVSSAGVETGTFPRTRPGGRYQAVAAIVIKG